MTVLYIQWAILGVMVIVGSKVIYSAIQDLKPQLRELKSKNKE